MTQYYPSGCGVFGVMRKERGKKIRGEEVLRAIEKVRHRGSNLGAGFAAFNLGEDNIYTVKAFSRDGNTVRNLLNSNGLDIREENMEEVGEVCNCSFRVFSTSALRVKKALRDINEIMWERGEGRIYSVGSGLQLYKGVGYPKDIADKYDIYNVEADMWIAHTRQPTNSPGHLPYWSHPFSSFNVAIVHNGDVSSFGTNVEFLTSRGWRTFVGTDSEVMAFLFEELISEGLSVREAAKVLANPSRRFESPDYSFQGARLDGPFTAVIGYNSGTDLHMVGIADRSKFRPAIVGESDDMIFIASEESQIWELEERAKVWTLRPGGILISTLSGGILDHGRDVHEIESFSPPPQFRIEGADIDAKGMTYRELNDQILRKLREKERVVVSNVNGIRFIGNNLPRAGVRDRTIVVYGVTGNSMGNLNNGNNFIVHGNVEDDCCDTMHSGTVNVLGDARDVLGQTLQGGVVGVKGNAGNRVGIQMREYRDRKPLLIVGGIVDDYLGEFMAGGLIVVLNTRGLTRPTGNFVGSGMVGGKILIRGIVEDSRVGLQPDRRTLMRFVKALRLGGYIGDEEYEKLSSMSYTKILEKLEGDAKRMARRMFEEKIGIPKSEYRYLEEGEIREIVSLGSSLGWVKEDLLGDKFTVITPFK